MFFVGVPRTNQIAVLDSGPHDSQGQLPPDPLWGIPGEWKDEWYGQQCLHSRPPKPRIAGRGGKAEYLCDLNWGGPLPGCHDEGKSRSYTHGGRGGFARMRCIHQRCIRLQWNHEWEIMGREGVVGQDRLKTVLRLR